MMNGVPQDEFEDPLDNYDPPEYDDPIERGLAEEPVSAIQTTPFTAVSPSTTVREAVRILDSAQHACLLVIEEDVLVGVFSDRDLLDKAALEYDTVKDRPIREFMTNDPIYVLEGDTAAAALCVMAVSGFRHVPVVDLSGKVLGIVSPQRVTGFLTSLRDAT